MKQLFFALLSVTALAVNAQKWQNIKGNGNIKTEERQVGSFTAVENNGSFDVEISYGESATVRVEADDNILPVISTKVKDNRLMIGTEKGGGFSSSHRLKVYVSMTTINSLAVNGSGNMYGEGKFSGSGTTKLEVSGSGNLKLGFNEFATVEAIVRGSGKLVLTDGSISNLNAAIYGSGDIDTYGTSSKNVMAKTSGSGNVKVKVTGSLTAEANGSGNVYYKGDITNVNMRSNGSGKVMKQS